ncbi:hypothetical protein ACQKLP_12910 [Chitinophaga sp. NPDC101104]|uniref:hypothetical protein n=1 Tax=Chitinophaga sp. NPDC101104 TaxID=3390561 RepID=UPI003D049BCE
MNFEYFPGEKIVLNGIPINFGTERASVREMIGERFTANDLEFEFEDITIVQRRDIYRDINGTTNYFFTGYNANDELESLELHQCETVAVSGVRFTFNDLFDEVSNKLLTIDASRVTDHEETIFPALKLIIKSDRQVGGEADVLGYLYCAIDHISND